MRFTLRYAPKDLDGVVYPNDDAERVIKSVAAGELERHLLLYGKAGTGKTTVANLIPRILGGNAVQSVFINARLESGMKTAKQIDARVRQALVFKDTPKHFVILDEADKLTTPCQDALRGIIDANQERSMFIFTFNQFTNVSIPLIDRCKCIRFDQVDIERLKNRAREINEDNESVLSENELETIVRASFGSLRGMYDLLEEKILIKTETHHSEADAA